MSIDEKGFTAFCAVVQKNCSFKITDEDKSEIREALEAYDAAKGPVSPMKWESGGDK